MAIMMSMEWPDVTPAQYDEIKRVTNFENDHPAGAIAHVVAFEGSTMRVVDIWESPDNFQAFIDAKVMPAVAQLGITSQPEVTILPAHNVFIPGK